MAAPNVSDLRAKRGYIVVRRYDGAGRVRLARNHVVSGMGGALSGKEMEREMMKVADQVGASHKDIRIEVYARGTAPVEVGRDRPGQHRVSKDSEIPAGDVQAYRSNFDRAFGRVAVG